jgi:hypothetical protein
MKLEDLAKDIEAIKKRNQSVESDKAWETSATRKILIALCTYFSIALYLKFIVHIDPWINAIVPAIGFMLSTLSLPWFKKLWKQYIYKKV